MTLPNLFAVFHSGCLLSAWTRRQNADYFGAGAPRDDVSVHEYEPKVGRCGECKHWEHDSDYDERRDESYSWRECRFRDPDATSDDAAFQDGSGFCHRFERKT